MTHFPSRQGGVTNPHSSGAIGRRTFVSARYAACSGLAFTRR